jgi:hypothetical protein
MLLAELLLLCVAHAHGSSEAARTTSIILNQTAAEFHVSTIPSSADDLEECDPLPYGHGPRPNTDSVLAFLQNPDFSIIARNSAALGYYTSVYSNEYASSVSERYLRYDELEVYSASNCSKQCDQTEGCQAFNIYFERMPTLNLGPKCKTSLSSTMIKCVLWGSKLNESDATNRGYSRWDFEVVIAGSNAYNKGGEAAKSVASSILLSGMVIMVVAAALVVDWSCKYL